MTEVPRDGEEGPKPLARTFRKYAPPSNLTPQQSQRQTDVLRVACQHIAPNGAAISFLNAHHNGLGGSPLQLAIESDDGLLRVEQHLASISGKKVARPSSYGGIRS